MMEPDSLAYEAMMFAREVHKDQRRKYTGNPYTDHLAEVAGIVATVDSRPDSIAVAWLHDCMEDQGVEYDELCRLFNPTVAEGVRLLSDIEPGNRATRKAASRERLALAPDWVQTIKVADLISNTASIVQHDPGFAKVYLDEKYALLHVLLKPDRRLVAIAREQIR